MSDFSDEIKKAGFKLDGHSMVEASAGTGKTYNIQNVYLRLILEKKLQVEDILVVTFTEAATHELRERIRKALSQARDYLSGKTLDNDQDQKRMEEIVDIVKPEPADDDRLRSIKLALMNFDNAAIFTIHGFCKRVLDRNSFECGHDPSAELVADESHIISSTCMDWWRGKTYAEENFRSDVAFKELSELQAYVKEFLKRPDALLMPELDKKPAEWSDLGKDLDKELTAYAKLLEARETEGGIPNAPAKNINSSNLPDLSKLLKAKQVDTYEIREELKKAQKVCNSAGFERTEFPEELHGVIDACADIADQLGKSLPKNITWETKLTIKPGTKDAIDLTPLQKIINKDRTSIEKWINDPKPALKLTQKKKINATATKLKDGLVLLCEENAEWSETTDATDFCKILKGIGNSKPSKALENHNVEEIAPFLTKSVKLVGDRLFGEMSKVITELSTSVRNKVKERGVLTYNDLLRNVSEALKNEKTAERLTKVLRDEFKAALIDEFQDTDPIQYSIFETLFKKDGTPLYLVGDPKQAIYGFRGGDVFTYYAAKKDLGEKKLQNLGTNYRSEQHLVDAINELFKDGDGDDNKSFINEFIPYDGTLKANVFDESKALLIKGVRDETPLKLHQFAIEGDTTPSTHDDNAMRIYADTADEIVSLIGNKDYLIGENKIEASDIAVLVCVHAEAKYIHTELKKRNINAVLQSTGNVFDSEDASDMAMIIQAMLDPSDISAVRGALITSLMPCSTEDLQRFSDENTSAENDEDDKGDDDIKLPVTLEGWLDIIKSAGDTWRKRSFIEAFRHLMKEVDMRNHTIRLPDGERRLTNVLHLVELAHKAASESQQGPVGLSSWFNMQLNSSTRAEQDDFEMRLSSDDDSVKIMTVFKSKGLQFPIVFAPTLWRKSAKSKHNTSKMLTYHDDNKVIMNLDSDNESAKDSARDESLQENLRLVYVALTRAIHRTYVTTVTAGKVEVYALQRLLKVWESRRDENNSCIDVKELSFDDPAPKTNGDDNKNDKDKKGSATLKTYDDRTGKKKPEVDKSHGHTSFSSLEPAERDAKDTVKNDDNAGDDSPEEDAAGLTAVATDIFSIPGNARTGTCWHDIFENIDFQADPEDIEEIADKELNRYGVCKGPTDDITDARKKAVYKMVQNTLDVPLSSPGIEDKFSLRNIAMSQRRSELEFNLSLKQTGTTMKTSVITEKLKEHWEGCEGDAGKNKRELFIPALKSWEKDIPLGFMTGFIDLVCCHEDKFYILDWKSNKRFGKPEDFDDAGIWDEMARKAYFLQYIFYTVALHGFLSRELKDYSYEENFGGVFYVFMRGITEKSDRGIFADRPKEALITDLAKLLTQGEGGVA